MPDIEFIAKDIIMLKKGLIVDDAPPHELVKKIDGKVWLVPCIESDVQEMQDRFRVTNIARDDQTGEILLRILAEGTPTDRAKMLYRHWKIIICLYLINLLVFLNPRFNYGMFF